MVKKAKARSLIVRMLSSAGTGFYYTTMRRRLLGWKLQLKKYDPIVGRHVLFTEGKVDCLCSRTYVHTLILFILYSSIQYIPSIHPSRQKVVGVAISYLIP